MARRESNRVSIVKRDLAFQLPRQEPRLGIHREHSRAGIRRAQALRHAQILRAQRPPARGARALHHARTAILAHFRTCAAGCNQLRQFRRQLVPAKQGRHGPAFRVTGIVPGRCSEWRGTIRAGRCRRLAVADVRRDFGQKPSAKDHRGGCSSDSRVVAARRYRTRLLPDSYRGRVGVGVEALRLWTAARW